MWWRSGIADYDVSSSTGICSERDDVDSSSPGEYALHNYITNRLSLSKCQKSNAWHLTSSRYSSCKSSTGVACRSDMKLWPAVLETKDAHFPKRESASSSSLQSHLQLNAM